MKRVNGVLVDDKGVEIVPMPAPLAEMLRERDQLKIALYTLDCWRQPDKPLHPPAAEAFLAPAFSGPSEVIKRWHWGTPVPEEWVPAFKAFLAAADAHVGVIEEAKRRLRTTLWCEQTLHAHGPRYALPVAALTKFHRECWQLAAVPHVAPENETIYALRERLVGQALAHKVRVA